MPWRIGAAFARAVSASAAFIAAAPIGAAMSVAASGWA
jgi:hypothetical protein